MQSIFAMKTNRSLAMISFVLLGSWFLPLSVGLAGTVEQIGSYANWTTTWQTLPGGIEADQGVSAEFDFVGDLTNPGLYWANSNDYIFFRMRVDADIFTTAGGAHLLLIDIVGAGNTGIDYGFAWDSKSADPTKHGLEMQIPDSKNGTTWGTSKMDDMDGNASIKAVNDINGFENSVQRSTDGYVRSIDGQNTTNFGATTFIDFAVKWSYLSTYTNLNQNQQWKIAVASIDGVTDHAAFNADMGNGAELTDSVTTTGWSSAILVPELSTALMMGLTGFFALTRRKRPVHV